ncbi:LuxR C-terminal-related transcriptional regulator [Micromonospora sp. NPDC049366]|uniref:LuxR C-terminal-related transcriptional regulator n=1 Tax=Micromonospora sp. NPDC049366 TaxID=3364271 RepID=UPI00379F0EC7
MSSSDASQSRMGQADGEASGLAVVSENAILRNGLAQVLASAPHLVVRHVVDTLTALPAGDDAPALVVLDLRHRGARVGASFWRLLPTTSRTVALCRPDDPPNLPTAIQGGARAFLSRDSDAAELLHAIDTVLHGGLHVSADLLHHLLHQTAPEPTGRESQLAAREVETLRLLAEGLTHGQISRRMGLTESTVSTYVKRIRSKLNAGNKAELTRRAIELGYVTPR